MMVGKANFIVGFLQKTKNLKTFKLDNNTVRFISTKIQQ